ncbi:uncharacterized protein FIBRA_02429 [Fibroporia radiculosa]|uniref:AAA+ ATPase domain-containing protein n=1 Tax=Fibroporia radiculosa TaxID=599839 RepID=J4H1U8_9APHY|nr:uncharacterized protein FIBRA_02429 [Fibroporia radiculosa]CCM00399.1 predicted protein [Fibroporia radiculosa]
MSPTASKIRPNSSMRTMQSSITSLFTPSGKSTRLDPYISTQSPVTPSARVSNTRKRSDLSDSCFAFEGPSKRSKPALSERLQSAAPLADRLRPTTLRQFVGQPHLTGPGSLLMHLLDTRATGSLIFWGPPGCGKTTLARLMAKRTGAIFKELSATDAGISDVRAVVEEAKSVLALTGKVFVLERLTDDDITHIITQAVERVSPQGPTFTAENSEDDTHDIPSSQPETEDVVPHPSSFSSTSTVTPSFPTYPQLTPKIVSSIASLSTGDARTALSLLELVLLSPIDADPDRLLSSLRQSVSTSYDRTGDSHYDMISALHKSVRGSQGSAALYWLARMLSAGEDPMYIARRMVVCASEDIGLADNHALPLAMATLQACQIIGMPECRINLAHLVSYLAEAPKSTRAYEGYKRAEEAAKLDATIPVPLPVRNAPTKLLKELGYARGYCYNPDYAHPVTNEYLPIQFRDAAFLKPAGDISDKVWDEDALRLWELEENEGRPWKGRLIERGTSQ